jgi:hypothetical protein
MVEMANFSAHSNSPFDKAKHNVHIAFTERAMTVHALSAVSFGGGRRPNAFLHYTSEWILRLLLSSFLFYSRKT